jgi:hypothetical protein
VIQIQFFHPSTIQDDMVYTPKVTSTGMSWNILHASIISFWIHVFHHSPYPLLEDEQKSKCRHIHIFDRQLRIKVTP